MVRFGPGVPLGCYRLLVRCGVCQAVTRGVPRAGSTMVENIRLSDAIFVGDGPNNELAGARDAGFSRVIFDSEFVAYNG